MEEEFIQIIEPDDIPRQREAVQTGPRQEAPDASREAPEPSKAKRQVFYSPVAQYSLAATVRQMQVTGVSAKKKTDWLLRDAALCDPRIPDLTRAHTSPDTYGGDVLIASDDRVAVVVNGDDLVYYTVFGRDLALAELAFFGDVPYDKVSDCIREVISPDDIMDARLKYSRSGNWFEIQKNIKEEPSQSAMEAAAHRADRSLDELAGRSEGLLTRAGRLALKGLGKTRELLSDVRKTLKAEESDPVLGPVQDEIAALRAEIAELKAGFRKDPFEAAGQRLAEQQAPEKAERKPRRQKRKAQEKSAPKRHR